MEISGIQIAVTVLVILGAAGIALVCDYLRAKNAALQEAMADLKSRQEQAPASDATPTASSPSQSELRPRLVMSKPTAQVLVMDAPKTKPEPENAPSLEEATAKVVAKLAAKNQHASGRTSRPADAIDSLVRKSNTASKAQKPQFDAAAMPRKKQMAAKQQQVPKVEKLEPAEIVSIHGRATTAVQETPAPQEETVTIFVQQEEMKSQDSLADWLSRRAATRSAQTPQRMAEVTATKTEPKDTAPVTPAPVPVETVATVEAAAPTLTVEPVEAVPVPVAAAPPVVEIEKPSTPRSHAYPEVAVDASLWESLLSGKSIPVAPAITVKATEPKLERTSSAPEAQFQLIRGSSSSASNELLVPAGMHEKSDLTRLLQSNKPFTGLVVSIGVSENDGRAPRNEDTMRSTAMYISGLLREKDFGCRAADDEFLMICPGEKGAEAQRRLSHIAERLWDFQLRGLGTYSILFSWGGYDVQGEPLSEAISAACDRMHQTMRSRKTVSMDSVSHRRKAAM